MSAEKSLGYPSQIGYFEQIEPINLFDTDRFELE